METTARAQHEADYRPYSQIDLLDSQLKRLPMWARFAIASADAQLHKGNRERAALLAALEEIRTHCAPLIQSGDVLGIDIDRIARLTIAQVRGDA